MVNNRKVKFVCDPGCILGECPIWHQEEHSLYFVDIEEGNIWRFDAFSGITKLFFHEDNKIGGITFTEDGSLLLCAENMIQKLKPNGNIESLLMFNFSTKERFNDITTDVHGRLYAGTMSEKDSKGKLLMVEKNREPETIIENINLSNGMGFSPDNKFFYHTTTKDYIITSYKYSIKTGKISNPHIFHRFNESDGMPDGMTVDLEGCIWTALWNGSAIVRLSPDGKIIEKVKLPAKLPTSLTFGGLHYRDLYITTSSWGQESPDNRVNDQGEFLGGPVYQISCKIGGHPEYPAAL